MISKAIILVKPDFAHKSERAIISSIKEIKRNSYHNDYMTLLLLLLGLRQAGYETSLLHWNELESHPTDKVSLIVIPQEMFIAGRIRNFDSFLPQLKQIINSGVNVILTHHHQGEFTEYFNIKSVATEKGYFSSVIQSLKLNLKEDILTKDINQFLQSNSPIKDEFTYIASKRSSAFTPVVEKLPQSIPSGVRKTDSFVSLAYKKFQNGNFAFLIDVHGTGRKGSGNGKLFTLLLRNALYFLSRKTSPFRNSDQIIIREIKTSSLKKTEKEALIASRIGQGQFRSNLISYWRGCAATGITQYSLLRASHIKPWRECNNFERLDIYNGLLLIPNLDQVLDQGYITLNDDGKVLISRTLSPQERSALGLKQGLSIKITEKHLKYVRYHRKHIFKN